VAEPQTHIVYRNRVEHDFYESGMMVPLGGGLLVGFLVFLGLCKLFERHLNRWSGDRGGNNMLMGGFALAAIGAGVAVFKYLML